jgi:hypothetical protein
MRIAAYLSVFTATFSNRADRDKFQAALNLKVGELIGKGDYKTRLPADPNIPITGPDEKGYEGFDSNRDAVWTSRSVVGFSDVAECDAFHAALIAAHQMKDSTLSFYANATGNKGAFNRDVIMVREPNDQSMLAF